MQIVNGEENGSHPWVRIDGPGDDPVRGARDGLFEFAGGRCRLCLMSAGDQNHGHPHRCCLNAHRRRSCPIRSTARSRGEFGVRPSGYPTGMRLAPPAFLRGKLASWGGLPPPPPADLRDTYLTRRGTTATWRGGNRWATTSPPTHLIGVSVSSPSRTACTSSNSRRPSCRRLTGAARCWG